MSNVAHEYYYTPQGRTVSVVTQHIYIDTNSHKLVKQVAHTLVRTWSLQAALNKLFLFDNIH